MWLRTREEVPVMPRTVVKPAPPVLKHTRTCVGIDVAACGARGVEFTSTRTGITCPECRVKRDARSRSPRGQRERDARQAHWKRELGNLKYE